MVFIASTHVKKAFQSCYMNGCLKIVGKIHRKLSTMETFFCKVADLRPVTVLKPEFHARWILRTIFLQNTFGGVPLYPIRIYFLYHVFSSNGRKYGRVTKIDTLLFLPFFKNMEFTLGHYVVLNSIPRISIFTKETFVQDLGITIVKKPLSGSGCLRLFSKKNVVQECFGITCFEKLLRMSRIQQTTFWWSL